MDTNETITNEARKAHQATCAHLWGPESMRYRQCVRCGLGWHTNDPAPRECHQQNSSEPKA